MQQQRMLTQRMLFSFATTTKQSTQEKKTSEKQKKTSSGVSKRVASSLKKADEKKAAAPVANEEATRQLETDLREEERLSFLGEADVMEGAATAVSTAAEGESNQSIEDFYLKEDTVQQRNKKDS